MQAGLSELEASILAFERHRWNHVGAKEAAVYDLFGMSLTRYHQQLHALLDKPAAMVADPQLVNRLRRLREQHRARRTVPRTA